MNRELIINVIAILIVVFSNKECIALNIADTSMVRNIVGTIGFSAEKIMKVEFGDDTFKLPPLHAIQHKARMPFAFEYVTDGAIIIATKDTVQNYWIYKYNKKGKLLYRNKFATPVFDIKVKGDTLIVYDGNNLYYCKDSTDCRLLTKIDMGLTDDTYRQSVVNSSLFIGDNLYISHMNRDLKHNYKYAYSVNDRELKLLDNVGRIGRLDFKCDSSKNAFYEDLLTSKYISYWGQSGKYLIIGVLQKENNKLVGRKLVIDKGSCDMWSVNLPINIEVYTIRHMVAVNDSQFVVQGMREFTNTEESFITYYKLTLKKKVGQLYLSPGKR